MVRLVILGNRLDLQRRVGPAFKAFPSCLQIQEYGSSMNKLQLSIFKTRLTLIAAALALVGLAAGLHRFIR